MEDSSDTEDSLKIAEKSWTRLIDAASTTGYREGIEEGAQAVLQDDFDRGYEDGFKAAFELGKYKGLSAIFSKDHEHPELIAEILEKTRRGACDICGLEDKEKENDESSATSTDIIAKHRSHVKSTLNILREYFEPFMKERGIDVNRLKTQS